MVRREVEAWRIQIESTLVMQHTPSTSSLHIWLMRGRVQVPFAAVQLVSLVVFAFQVHP